MAARGVTQALDEPIRVVVFGGAFFEPSALRFLIMLEEHPDVEFLGAICQSRGFGLRDRVADVARRRGVLTPAVLAVQGARRALRFLRSPVEEMRLRRSLDSVFDRVEAVPDIHALPVLRRVEALQPHLGLVYGSPILRPELFEIPARGTFGIHHGKLPDYRGKKTTFWAIYNGEPTAGVSIQRINAGLDRGEIVTAGEVPTLGRRFGRVEKEVEELGLRLYLEAVLGEKRGETVTRSQPAGPAHLYRQPSALDILRLWQRRFRRRVRSG